MIELPERWVETTLGEVAEIVSGSTPSTKKGEYWNGDISWITPKDLSGFQNRYIAKGGKSITDEGLKNSSARLLPKNTVLFSSRAPIGYVAIAAQELTTNQGFKNIICDDGVSYYPFIYYWLIRNSDYIEKLSSGSTFSEASASLMRSLEIKLPPLPEQKAIAGVLSAFDDKIELLREQNCTLESLAQTIFKEWFVNFNFPDIDGKPYKDNGGEMVDSELGEIPKGWRVGKLGEEFDISIGRTPPRKEKQWFSMVPTGKKWASIKDMVNSGVYIFDTTEYLTDEAIIKFNIPVIPKGTVILSFKMTVGKLAITTEEMLSNEAIAHIKLKPNSKVSSEYIYLFLQKLDFNSLGSTSSIVTAINSTMIKKMFFLIPDIKITRKFDDLIFPIFKKIKNNAAQIQTLSKTRDTLLPKLMSGEIRVKGFEQ